MTHPLLRVIHIVGVTNIARNLGLSYQAVGKWLKAGRMPRTEWTGETSYSTKIAEMTGGVVTKEALLDKWPDLAADTEGKQHVGPAFTASA